MVQCRKAKWAENVLWSLKSFWTHFPSYHDKNCRTSFHCFYQKNLSYVLHIQGNNKMKQNILVECGRRVVVNKSYKFHHTKKLKSRKLREIYGFKIFLFMLKRNVVWWHLFLMFTRESISVWVLLLGTYVIQKITFVIKHHWGSRRNLKDV